VQFQFIKAADMNLSIVVPVFNESENLPLLHESVHNSLDGLDLSSWEIIYVDDGSTDDSFEVMRKLSYDDPDHVIILSLRRNFGQTAAITAGIDYSSGQVIVLIDADLQNDPADIPMLIEKINSGYDVVSGWRVNRQDTFFTRKFPSIIANWLISTVTGVHLHDYGCTLKAYRREVLTNFRLYGEMHRFIPAYANSVGAKITEVPVTHHSRKFGKTKYGISRTLKVILDLFTTKFLISFAYKPIYLFGGAGLFLIVISAAVLFFLLIRRLWVGTSVIASPLFQTSLTFFILGFQSILMGLIAELLVRTYHESQAKPTYTIRTVIKGKQEE
jgi:glycosyltransferase involved in cell wall biosynthesis